MRILYRCTNSTGLIRSVQGTRKVSDEKGIEPKHKMGHAELGALFWPLEQGHGLFTELDPFKQVSGPIPFLSQYIARLPPGCVVMARSRRIEDALGVLGCRLPVLETAIDLAQQQGMAVIKPSILKLIDELSLLCEQGQRVLKLSHSKERPGLTQD
jgi:hypothetical protein